jgi:hypothetical protein
MNLGFGLRLGAFSRSGGGGVNTVTGGSIDDGVITLSNPSIAPGADELRLEVTDSLPEWNGTYDVSLASLAAGPVRIVAMTFDDPNVVDGVLDIIPSLYLSINGPASVTRQLLRGGDTPVALEPDYTRVLTADDIIEGYDFSEAPTDAAGTPSPNVATIAEPGSVPTYGDAVSIDLGSGATVGTVATIGAIDGGRAGWRQHSGAPDFTATNILDNTGAATTLDLTADFSANSTARDTDDTTATWDMFNRGGGVLSGSGTTLAFSQIPYAKYDVVLYFSSVFVSATMNVSDGTTTYYTLGNDAGNWTGNSSTFARAEALTGGAADDNGNYMHWEGLTSASLTLTAISSTSSAMALCGVQIIERTD